MYGTRIPQKKILSILTRMEMATETDRSMNSKCRIGRMRPKPLAKQSVEQIKNRFSKEYSIIFQTNPSSPNRFYAPRGFGIL